MQKPFDYILNKIKSKMSYCAFTAVRKYNTKIHEKRKHKKATPSHDNLVENEFKLYPSMTFSKEPLMDRQRQSKEAQRNGKLPDKTLVQNWLSTLYHLIWYLCFVVMSYHISCALHIVQMPGRYGEGLTNSLFHDLFVFFRFASRKWLRLLSKGSVF